MSMNGCLSLCGTVIDWKTLQGVPASPYLPCNPEKNEVVKQWMKGWMNEFLQPHNCIIKVQAQVKRGKTTLSQGECSL